MAVRRDTITPEFVRTVLVPRVFTAIAARKGTTEHHLELLAARTSIGVTDLQRSLHHLALEIGRLRGEIANRSEIEAIELAKQGAQVRRITEALPPPKAVGGLGLSASSPKPTQIPPDLPPCYPNNLKPQTHMIIAEAVRKFPDQTHALELCKYVISRVTSLFRAAVQSSTLPADLALSDSGMGGLLHSLLVYNCDNGNDRFQLGQEARKSDERLKLAQEIADVAQSQSEKKSKMSVETPDAAKHLHEAILKKKARLASIERTLNRPLPTEHRGRPVRVSIDSLLRLEEERQDLLIAVEELERDRERLDQTGRTPRVTHADAAEGNSGQTEALASTKHSRLRATINCPSAARRMEAFLQSRGMSQTTFAIQVGTTDRTLRSFRKTGRVRRDLFDSIAKKMNITKEELLKPE